PSAAELAVRSTTSGATKMYWRICRIEGSSSIASSTGVGNMALSPAPRNQFNSAQAPHRLRTVCTAFSARKESSTWLASVRERSQLGRYHGVASPHSDLALVLL